jgi:hypothetical protein
MYIRESFCINNENIDDNNIENGYIENDDIENGYIENDINPIIDLYSDNLYLKSINVPKIEPIMRLPLTNEQYILLKQQWDKQLEMELFKSLSYSSQNSEIYIKNPQINLNSSYIRHKRHK